MNTSDKPTTQAKSWRDVLPIHPAADFFPPMAEAELAELGADTSKHGSRPSTQLVKP
jgi:hypothetical protein